MTDNVQEYYDQYSEKEWNRLGTVSQIEYFVTKKLLEELIGGLRLKILDLGGGPGRYAIELTKQGHEVTLVDLSESNLALANKKSAEEKVTIYRMVHASAIDLSIFPDDYFDLVLSMGPMYHLTEDADLKRANWELLRVMRPGGYAFVAFITKLAILRDILFRDPDRLINYSERYHGIMERGVIIQSVGLVLQILERSIPRRLCR